MRDILVVVENRVLGDTARAFATHWRAPNAQQYTAWIPRKDTNPSWTRSPASGQTTLGVRILRPGAPRQSALAATPE